MASPHKVYVASPLGFTPYGLEYQAIICQALVDAEFEPLDPWASDMNAKFKRALAIEDDKLRRSVLAKLNWECGAHNGHLIDQSHYVLANLDDPGVDPGVASEIGHAATLGKPIVGLRLDMRLSGDNEMAPVNLQILYYIHKNGGIVTHTLSAAVRALVRLREKGLVNG